MTETYCKVTNFRTVLNFVLSYFWKKVRNLIPDENFFLVLRPSNFNVILFWGPRSTKISSYEPVSSQKYENRYRTKICNFTVCERRSCMKNNGKSPTFKFVSGEERRRSEVQRVSRDWRLPSATHSSADLTWPNPKMTENSGSGAVRAGMPRAWAWELLFRLR